MKQDMCWSGELIFPFSKKKKIFNFIFGMGGGFTLRYKVVKVVQCVPGSCLPIGT